MRIQPQSTVDLYSGVDIDFQSGIEIAFSSQANQISYFTSKRVRRDTHCTVVKKTGRLRLEVAGSVIKNCNYLSFINPSFDNKVIYAAILDYDYINNECTEITYQIDFWQTWMFEIDFERSGIVRQYLNETDYTKAVANPYNPDIYAFQTPEELPYNKQLEKYNYEYNLYTQSGSRTLDNIPTGDGYYPMLAMKCRSSDDAVLTLRGIDNTICYCFMIAPIDFDSLGDTAKTKYDNFIAHVKLAASSGGAYIPANSDPIDGCPWSLMPHPFDVFMIPKSLIGSLDAPQGVTTAAMELIYDLTTWNALSQIIAVYAVPAYAVPYMTIWYNTTQGSDYADFDVEDTFNLKTSYQRRNSYSYVPHCQKLYLSPFSYMRTETPDGETKEYRYEDFKNVIDGTSTEVTFRICSTLNGKINVLLLPCKYKSIKLLSNSQHAGGGTGNHEQYTPDIACNFNLDERMELKSFPQIAFTTDAFLAHLSATYMSSVAQNTSQAQAEREYGAYQNELNMGMAGYDMATGGMVGNAIQGAVEGFKNGGVVGGIAGLFGGGLQGGRNELEVQSRAAAANFAYENTYGVQKEMLQEAQNFLSDPSKDNPRFNDTKPAYANNQYHPGSMGDSMYIKYSAINDFKITHVRLRDAILQKYDEYFKTYGYNFGATVGIPYVVSYVGGSSSNDELPHWEQVNGKDSTYVKTHDCHVTHAMKPVAFAIEGMFNCGIRMLKGESLLPSNS